MKFLNIQIKIQADADPSLEECINPFSPSRRYFTYPWWDDKGFHGLSFGGNLLCPMCTP